MELFDKKFVHFMWDNELKGKECFVADDIHSLRDIVERNRYNRQEVGRNFGSIESPFRVGDGSKSVGFKFAYYDPNYEVKKAFNEGKEIQFKDDVTGEWCLAYNPRWDLNIEYRVKPEEKTVVAKRCSGCVHEHCSATKEPCVSCKPDSCKYEAKEEMNDKMNPIQEKKMRRYNLSLGDWDELKEMAVKMFKGMAALNERFAEKISEGGFITQDDWKESSGLWQTFNYITDENEFCKDDLHHLFTEDEPDEEFVEIKAEVTKEEKDEKPECPCEDGIDSKACVGCEHSEDGKPHPFENYHCYVCDKSSETKYRPYESVEEFIQDFQERYGIKYNPSCSMPTIWLWDKELDRKCLVRDFESDKVMCASTSWTMEELFDRWTYLDDSPVGIEVKE
jgi:hypothetical protein